MGLKKIQALRQEMWKKADSLNQFKEAVAELAAAHEKIAKAYANLEKLRADGAAKVERIPTHGVKEFDDYKKSLIAVYQGWGNRPLPTKPLDAVVERERKAVDEAVKARVDKLAASFPSQVKKGMVFKMSATGKLYEISGDEQKSKNPNLKGEAAIFWDTIDEKGARAFPISLADLKKSYKFIKA